MHCGVATYCCQQHCDAHWPLHRSLCSELRRAGAVSSQERERGSGKEAAREQGSGGRGFGDTVSLSSTVQPQKRYTEAELYSACFNGSHEEVDQILKQLGLDANWATPDTGATAAYADEERMGTHPPSLLARAIYLPCDPASGPGRGH